MAGVYLLPVDPDAMMRPAGSVVTPVRVSGSGKA
jgi:hypothetical protein